MIRIIDQLNRCPKNIHIFLLSSPEVADTEFNYLRSPVDTHPPSVDMQI